MKKIRLRPAVVFGVLISTHALSVKAEGFPASVELSSLDGSNGFILNGIAEGGQSPLNVASAGDINRDGIDDFVIGAPNADVNGTTDAGQAYVVFGTDQGFPNTLELSALDGTNGFTINGIAQGDFSGISVSPAGDVNRDGIDDVIIGAWNASPDGKSLAGQSYVVFGTDQGFPAILELSALDGTNGFTINGIAETDFSGISVSAAGDVNGDTFDDLIIGANGVDLNGLFNVGQAYVVFGTNAGLQPVIDLSSLDGDNGFAVNGEGLADFDNTGLSVSSGDVNGDGLYDIIIGAPGAPVANRDTRGRAYVMLGTDQGFSAELELAALDGSNGFVINGIAEGDFAGKSVASADVNGDGFDDVIIGAQGASPNDIPRAGQSYVVFGSDQVFPAALELSAVDGSNGFAINGIAEGDFSGITVSPAGDINRDGDDDIVIGAPFASPNGINGAGQSYVVFGSSDREFPATLELSALDGTTGFLLNGVNQNGRSGWSVSSAGDVNGDSIGDLIIGSNFADPDDPDESGQSQSYVVFGQNASPLSPVTTIYFSTTTKATLGGLKIREEDIAAFDISTGTWSRFFDGSDVGLGNNDVNAFHINSDGAILLSLKSAATLPDVGAIEDSDILRFTPTSTGDDTSGTFEMYLDGSDVELSGGDNDVDTIGFTTDGRLLISTKRSATVGGLSANDEDLLAFTVTTLGESTSGTWEMYFDGSDMELNDSGQEDVGGAWIDDNDEIYLTTKGAFSVTGASGDGADIFVCVPVSTGDDTSCGFSLFFDGSDNGLTGEAIDGIYLER